MQPKIIDNPSHCLIFKKLLERPVGMTISEFVPTGKMWPDTEMRTLNRKLNKLALFGFIEKQDLDLFNEKKWIVNYSQLANTFWKHVCEEYPEFSEKNLHLITQEQLTAFIKFYINQSLIKENKTIRGMFINVILRSYSIVEKVEKYKDKLPEKQQWEYENFKGTHGNIHDLMATIGFYSLKEKWHKINP